MRYALFCIGIMAVVIGAAMTASADKLDVGSRLVDMLVVVCGCVFVGSGAIISAVESLRAPAVPQPQQFYPPMQGGPPVEPR